MSLAHPAFDPYRALIAALDLAHGPPPIARLDALSGQLGCVNARGLPVRFVASERPLSARDYETGIFDTGTVPTRAGNWHDVFNALVWLRFPATKAAINAAHVAALPGNDGARRGPRRDALTVLDESGVVVTAGDAALTALLAARQWHTLFWERRAQVAATLHAIVIGHALLEKALDPYPAMTGKCLVIDGTAHDETIAAHIGDIRSPAQLLPLPVQGLPGWDAANSHPGYYANREVFRP